MRRAMATAVIAAMLLLSVTAVVSATGTPDTGTGTIKIGMYQDLSAGTAQWGTDSKKGADLRVKEINAAGGVLGRQIELVTYDCKGTPTESVKNYTRLVQEDQVVAVYGSLNSNTGLAVGPVAEQMKIAVVTRCMDERVTTPDFKPETPDNPGRVNPYVFLLQPSCYQQSAMIAGYAIDELKFNTFAMLFTPSNAYSYMMAKGFEYYLAKRGKKLVGSFEFQAGDLDYRAQLTKVKELNPDALFVPAYVTENANSAKQAKELGLKATLLGNNSWFEPLDEVAGESADGAYFPLNISRDNPKLQWYIEKYEKEYGEKPRLHSFSGWDDIGFILEAIKKAKSTDPQKIRNAMEEMKKYEGVIGTINMDPATHRSYGLTMSILKIVGKKFTTAEMAYYPKQVK
ncbi:MAG: ABC transporter substrate-binding protein [Spirochaetes bacterium]|nr:ABC transporter substrate-binding protein [Spirochaetota bacterium]